MITYVNPCVNLQNIAIVVRCNCGQPFETRIASPVQNGGQEIFPDGQHGRGRHLDVGDEIGNAATPAGDCESSANCDDVAGDVAPSSGWSHLPDVIEQRHFEEVRIGRRGVADDVVALDDQFEQTEAVLEDPVRRIGKAAHFHRRGARRNCHCIVDLGFGNIF